MARVTVLAQYYYPAFKAGGPVPGVRNALRALNSHAVHVYTSDRDLGDRTPFPAPHVGTISVDNATVTYLPDFAIRTPRAWLLAAKRLLSGDAVYVNSLFSTWYSIFPLILMHVLRFRGVVAIAPRGELAESALHLGRTPLKRMWLSLLRRFAMYRSIGTKGNVVWLASSDHERADVARAFPGARVYLSPETLREPPPATLVTRKRGARDELQVVCVGRVSPVKGIIELVDGLAHVTGRVHLRLIGPAEDAAYVARVRAAEAVLPDTVRVSWLGALPTDVVMRYLQTADLAVLLSHGENFGHAIGEALMVGCPVLISDQTPWSFVAKENAGVALSSRECHDPLLVARAIEDFAALSASALGAMREAAQRCGEAGLVLPGTVDLAQALGLAER